MILPYFIIIPLLAAFLITLFSREKDYWSITVSTIASATMLVLSIVCFITLKGETFIYNLSGWKIPFTICLVRDSLSCFMIVIIQLISFTSLLFSVNYIRHISSSWKYYSLFMFLVAGMNGVVSTGDIFNLFVFMEIALFAAYALVSYGGKAFEFEAAFKYAVIGSISSTLILVGIGITYSATSSLTLAHIAQVLPQKPDILVWVGVLFLVGFGIKAAIMPFHAWLPDAHSSAPAPISSMLSGVLIKALGIYVLIRLFFNVFGAPPVFMNIFMVLGAASIIIASFLAIGQWDMKRLLAYSSISQIGFILLALGISTKLAILGAVFHIFNHAIFKSLLFYNAGSIEMAIGTRDLREMGNLKSVLPVTYSTSLIGTLSVSGLPPFNGFFSKLIIIVACVQAGYITYATIAIIGSLLTLAYFLKVQRYAFHGDKLFDVSEKSIGGGMKFAMLFLALLCVVTGVLLIPALRQSMLDPIVDTIFNKTEYIKLVLGSL